jgi:hypothetical protein
MFRNGDQRDKIGETLLIPNVSALLKEPAEVPRQAVRRDLFRFHWSISVQ